MRLTGAILCVAAWVAAGAGYYRNEKRRLAALGSLSRAFSAMNAGLSLHLAAMPELLRTPSEGFAAIFLENASKGLEKLGETGMERIWTDALKACPPLLSEDEESIVRSLGGVLGACTLETQLRALSDAAARLDERAEELRRKLPTARKLSFGLSAAFGLLTTILLM